MYKISHD